MDEDKCYLHFSSYYNVATASDILTGYHIRNKIVRAPVAGGHSCSFAVMIDKKDEDMCRFIIERKGFGSR